MAEPLPLSAQTPARALKPGQVQIRGKISGRRIVAGQDGRVSVLHSLGVLVEESGGVAYRLAYAHEARIANRSVGP